MRISKLVVFGSIIFPTAVVSQDFSLLIYAPVETNNVLAVLYSESFSDGNDGNDGEMAISSRSTFKDSKKVCMDEAGEGRMYNLDAGHCEDRPTFVGVARFDDVAANHTRIVTVSMPEYTLTVSHWMYSGIVSWLIYSVTSLQKERGESLGQWSLGFQRRMTQG